MKTTILALILTFITTSTFASNNRATVIFVRGKVTKLLPKSHNAKTVKKGDTLPEDTSVLTSKKGIVKVRMPDNSIVSLGPKSKLVVALMKKGRPSMLGLLKGVVRAEIEKGSNSKNKMIIKTRTAAMGIRGTKLKTSFNPETRTTSLVTIEGKVAMAKIQEKKIIKEAQEETKAESGKKVNKKTVAYQNKVEERELEKLEDALNDSDTVEVDQGRFAGVNIKLAKPIEPTKVAPKQMVAIATHDELAVEKIDEKEYAKELDEVLKKDADDGDDAEQEFDKSDGKLKPKDGGLVDFSSGIYVPPSEDSKLDKEKGIYIAKEDIGKSANNGDYVAPKGLKLDAKKGFVVSKKKITVAQRAKLEESVKLLNNDVKKLVVTDKEIKDEIKAELAMVSGKKYEREKVSTYEDDEEEKDYLMNPTVKDYGLEVSITPFVTNITVDSDPTNAKNELASVAATNVGIAFSQKWKGVKNLKTSIFAGVDVIDFDDNEKSLSYDQDKKAFAEFGIGAEYELGKKNSLSLALSSKSVPFIDASNNSTYQVLYSSVDTKRVSLGYKTLLLDNGSHNGYAGLILSAISGSKQASKTGGTSEIDVKEGHAAQLNWDMSFNNIKALNLSAGAYLRYERQNIDESQYRRYTFGIGAKAIF